jgi:hypothetical protein
VTSNIPTTIAIRDRVEAGAPGTDDYDTGTVFEIDGDKALVAWDSGVRTSSPIADLTVVD